jgi:hypothetical protein
MPTGGRGLSEIELDKLNHRLVDLGYDGLREEQRAVVLRGGNEAMEILQHFEDNLGIKTNDLISKMTGGKDQYRSSHFDEPNVLAHLRMSDRVTDGKKTLLVDEVQSDWHQAGRERGYRTPESIAKQAEVNQQLKRLDLDRLDLYDELKAIQLHDTNYPFNNDWLEVNKKISENTKQQSTLKEQALSFGSIPDAPYKDDWYQLALRRAVKEAIDGGYDRVALPTGQRVAERFDLSKHIDRIDYNKNSDGTYRMSAIKDEGEVFARENIPEKDLPSHVGKEMTRKILAEEGDLIRSIDEDEMPTYRSLSGLDLQVGGEGMKKYYDEIYPGYLKKFGKKYGATVGKTDVVTDDKVDGIFTDNGKFLVDSGDGINFKEFNTYAEAAKHLGVGVEPLHYMDITPAMRKEFSTGIHMKKGGKVSFAPNVDAMRRELTKAK